MELVVQFGFIVLFSSVFPLAALMSLISNFIQVKSQTNNLQYQRRFKAEVSNGIGTFLNCLQIMTQLSVMINSGIIYFTSRTIKKWFLDNEQHIEKVELHSPINRGWELVNFLVLVIVVEHGMLIIKIFVEQVINDTPEFVVHGERERMLLLENYQDKRMKVLMDKKAKGTLEDADMDKMLRGSSNASNLKRVGTRNRLNNFDNTQSKDSILLPPIAKKST